MFSKEYLSNKFFANQALGFNAPLPEKVSDKRVETGAILQENGDYVFRIYAPNALDVRIELAWNDKPLVLEKNSEGFFEGVYKYNIRLTGQVGVTVLVDGAVFLSPFIPIFWTLDRPCNYIEVPDYEMNFALINDVPHGAYIREIYWVEEQNSYQRCFIYTPPGYMKGDKKYPVLYLLHGGMDNEISWEYGANICQIMDNNIASGASEEFVVVMNNGMLRYEENKFNNKWDLALENMIINSCIPYIESNYRVKTDKWSRAIGGLSMGSYQTNDIGFRHPELFGYMGQFTASITHEKAVRTYERKYEAVLSNSAKFSETYRVFWRSTTPNEDHFEYFVTDDNLYKEFGIDKLPCYYRNVYPDGTSRWKSWRMGVRDYTKLLFR